MNCVCCGAMAVTERPEVMARSYRLTLRNLSEIMALRGIGVSHEAVRDWEAKLLPVMGNELGKRRHGTRRCSGASWFVDETNLKVCGRWTYLYL